MITNRVYHYLNTMYRECTSANHPTLRSRKLQIKEKEKGNGERRKVKKHYSYI
jgi:hypothetical protein